MRKRPLSLAELRKVPNPFSWLDQRLLRESYIDQLSHQAGALYLFLLTVADAQGLSFDSDLSRCRRLSIAHPCLFKARKELTHLDPGGLSKAPLSGLSLAYAPHCPPASNPDNDLIRQAHGAYGYFQAHHGDSVMLLCYSRMMDVEFTVSQTMEHFSACHQHAFECFGGVAKKVMVDNLKSAVLRRALGEAPVLNPNYLDYANHQGFTITPCNVGKGNEKGRVENAVGYVKKNFLAGLDIPDFSALNPAARHWLDTVANVPGAWRNKAKTG